MEISNKLKYFILFISFIEGGSVMFAELIGAKLVAPYFGTSLYVWASAIGLTLGSLAIGYFTGGWLSKRMKNTNLIFWMFILGGIFILLMPVSGKWIMETMIHSSIQTGVTVSMLVFLCPSLIFFGMMSPVIINVLTKEAKSAGRMSGLVYSISTLGGIVFTYLTGFYLLPEFGIIRPTLILGSIILLISLIYLLLKKKWLVIVPVLLIIFANPFSLVKEKTPENLPYKLVYSTEGILGQLKVVDYPYYTMTRGQKPGRGLLVNNTGQTIMDLQHPEYSLWDYAFFFPAAASIFPEGSDALILGMGGGTLYKQYKRLGFNVDVAELDERIKDVSMEYFYVPKDANIKVDDARHFLNTIDKKYDIITFDLFLSETPPSHLLTQECFSEVKKKLKEGGILLINFYGYTSGKIGIASRSVYKTLNESFEYAKMMVTPSRNEMSRNLIFIASNSKKDFTNVTYSEPDLPVYTNLEAHFLDESKMDFGDAQLLTDDRPVLEHLYIDAALEWRMASNQSHTELFIRNKAGNFK